MSTSATSLSKHDTQKGLTLVLREGLVTQCMVILTSGTFLIAFALELGANPLQIGIISSIPLYANVLQIFSVALVSLGRSRKKVVVIATLIGRSTYAGIALLPWVQDHDHRLYLMMLALAVQHCLGAIATGSWSSWMRDLIPAKQRGRFLSYRLFCIQILSVLLSIGIALFLAYAEELVNQNLYVYACLFMIGSLAGIAGSLLLSKTPEPAHQNLQQPFFSLLKLPFRHSNFRRLIFFASSWNFVVNLTAPFLTVYFLQTLGLPMVYVIGFTTLSQLGNIVFFRFWGYYADRFSNKTIFKICGPIYLLTILGIIFATHPDVHGFTLPWLICLLLLSGVASAGTSLAYSSMCFNLTPQDHSVAYLSVLSLITALAAGTAPILAGSFIELTQSWDWTLTVAHFTIISLRSLDFLFFVTFLLGLLAINLLHKIHESGDVPIKVLLREVVVKMKRLSRVNARQPWFLQFPSSVYLTLAFSRKKPKTRAVKY